MRLYNIANRMDSILHHAQEEKPTYPEFLSLVLGTEVEMKERKDYERRLVAARLPRKHDLDEYDYNFYEGIDRRQMKELRELVSFKKLVILVYICFFRMTVRCFRNGCRSLESHPVHIVLTPVD